MTWNRGEIKKLAKRVLKKGYWQFLVVGLIFALVSGVFSATYSTDKTIIRNIKMGLGTQSSVFRTEPGEKLTAKKFIENIVQDSDINLKDKNKILDKINSTSSDDAALLVWDIIVVILSIVILISIIKALVDIFLFLPLRYGVTKTCILGLKEKEVDLVNIGGAFRKGYGKIVLTLFLRELYVALWSLLFIFPGIIKRYEYRMVEYLIANDPEMTRKEAFSKSKEMMKGNKWKVFVLDLSFIGWIILGWLTLGVVMLLWVIPYILLTETVLFFKLYELKYLKTEQC